MGLTIRQPMEATALTLGGIPIKSGPITTGLACVALAAWITVAVVLVIGVQTKWTVATVGLAVTLAVAAMASKVVEAISIMLTVHADRNTTTAQAQSRDLRNQVFSLNWLMTSASWGEQKAKFEAAHMYEPHGPSDTGPFRIVNGAG